MIKITEPLITGKNAGRYKYNKEIFQKYKQYFSCVSEFLYYYQNPEQAERESRCRTCGKKTVFLVSTGKYQKHCNLKCANNDPEVKKKIHDSSMRIGKDGLNSYQRGLIKQKQVLINKYGVDNIFKDKDRMKQAYMAKLGVDNPFKKESVKEKYKQTCKDKYGVDWFSQTESYKDKMISTKRKNHSFNKSKSEEIAYQKLLNKFGKEDVYRQYRSKDYPFACDFYIRSLNLYIECNYSWVHGNWKGIRYGIFDKNNVEHLNVLAEWQNKHTKYYDNAIHVWTEMDVKKFNAFNENNLNYKIFKDPQEFDQWYENI
jgi:hypothetical protein